MNTEPPPIPPPFVVPPKKRDYLIPSILTTLLCCLPFGVIAIVCSVQANSAYSLGNFDEADLKSRQAFRWMIAGVIGVFLVVAVSILALLVGIVCAALEEPCDYYPLNPSPEELIDITHPNWRERQSPKTNRK